MNSSDVDGRKVIRRRFRDDVLTQALPAALFRRAEEKAENSILQTPAWRRIENR